MAFDFAKWLPLILGGASAGSQLIGSKMASGQMDKGNELAQQNSAKMFQMADQERQRRDALSQMFMPSIMKSMGYRGQIPQQFQMGGQAPGATAAPGSGQPSTAVPVPSTPSSGLGKAMGAGGAAVGALGLAGLSVPVVGPALGPAMALGGYVANKFGQGRRTDDQFVNSVENPFGKQLGDVSAELGTDPNKAKTDFGNAYQNYQNQANGWIGQGGKQAIAAQQSLSNPKLLQTIQTLKQQLGIV